MPVQLEELFDNKAKKLELRNTLASARESGSVMIDFSSVGIKLTAADIPFLKEVIKEVSQPDSSLLSHPIHYRSAAGLPPTELKIRKGKLVVDFKEPERTEAPKLEGAEKEKKLRSYFANATNVKQLKQQLALPFEYHTTLKLDFRQMGIELTAGDKSLIEDLLKDVTKADMSSPVAYMRTDMQGAKVDIKKGAAIISFKQ